VEDIGHLLHGFAVALSWYNIGMMAIGIVLGIIIGVLPGLGGPNGVAILLPLTFTMPPTSAIIMLSCIYWGTLFAGAITSILFNIPGETHSVATTFDGYPLAQQGRAGEALTCAFTGSFVGALAGVLLITFLAPLVAKFALKFGPPEFFAVYLLTFCSFIGTGKDALKTILSLMLGFGMAAVGMDTVSAQLRMTFGSMQLLRGIDFLVVVIGLFGIGEILVTMEEGLAFKGKTANINSKVVLETWAKLPRYWLSLIRSSLIGCWMGITPGGATAASFMGYGIAKRFSPNSDKFGQGELEGVIAPETSAHAAGTSALLPMLALGIPGSATAAVLLGGLMIWGLQPGPLLFVEQRDFVWGLIASMYLSNIAGLIIVLTTVPVFAAILRIPFSIIAPIIIVVCGIGAYTVHSAMFDVWLMVIFGVVGYVFKKLDYPLAPLVLAVVLGNRMEIAFRQTMVPARGDLTVFWSNGLVGSITTLAIVMLCWPLISAARARLRKTAAGPAKPARQARGPEAFSINRLRVRDGAGVDLARRSHRDCHAQ
jgi:putative tricarboxylic transport membrane protein